jgi:hypothetical protein
VRYQTALRPDVFAVLDSNDIVAQPHLLGKRGKFANTKTQQKYLNYYIRTELKRYSGCTPITLKAFFDASDEFIN